MEVRVNCPMCHHMGKAPDTKEHFYLNTAKNKGHCFRCGYSTVDAKKFALRHGISLNNCAPSVPEEQTLCRLPAYYSTNFCSEKGQVALDYLVKRHISRITIAAYEIGYCFDGRYRDRVVIPIYKQGELVTWIARDWTGEAKEKYLHPKGCGKNVVFNLERAKRSSTIILCEGVFDALRLPKLACALLGKQCSMVQRKLILAPPRPKAILIGLDNDAEEEAQRISSVFEGLVSSVSRLSPPSDHDLGDAPEEWIREVQESCGQGQMC